MANVKLTQNDCFALGEEELHICDLEYQRGWICLALTAGVLQDVWPLCWEMVFLLGRTKVENTHQSAPDSSHLQNDLFMHVQCMATVRYLHKYNSDEDTMWLYSPKTIQNYQTSNSCSFCFDLHHFSNVNAALVPLKRLLSLQPPERNNMSEECLQFAPA